MLISGCGNKPRLGRDCRRFERDAAIVARARPGKTTEVCKAQVNLRRV
jgi:hypothetical protein